MHRFSSRLTELGSFAQTDRQSTNIGATCDIPGAPDSDLKTRAVFVQHSYVSRQSSRDANFCAIGRPDPTDAAYLFIYVIYLLISFIYFISSPTKVRIIATHNVAVYTPHCAYVNVLDEIAPGVKFFFANVANTDWIQLHF
jgi:hypothetical protein